MEPLGHAHNYYLNLAAELGLLGLSGFLLVFGLAFRAAIRGLRGHDPFWRTVALGALGSLVAIALHSAFDNLYVHGVSVQIGALFALAQLASLHAVERRVEVSSHVPLHRVLAAPARGASTAVGSEVVPGVDSPGAGGRGASARAGRAPGAAPHLAFLLRRIRPPVPRDPAPGSDPRGNLGDVREADVRLYLLGSLVFYLTFIFRSLRWRSSCGMSATARGMAFALPRPRRPRPDHPAQLVRQLPGARQLGRCVPRLPAQAGRRRVVLQDHGYGPGRAHPGPDSPCSALLGLAAVVSFGAALPTAVLSLVEVALVLAVLLIVVG